MTRDIYDAIRSDCQGGWKLESSTSEVGAKTDIGQVSQSERCSSHSLSPFDLLSELGRLVFLAGHNKLNHGDGR